nr:MAG TPA: hypothetical protein [Caudoviricetes sp.]
MRDAGLISQSESILKPGEWPYMVGECPMLISPTQPLWTKNGHG